MEIPLIVRPYVHNLNIQIVKYVYNTAVEQNSRSRIFYNDDNAGESLTPAISLFYVPNDFDDLKRLNVFKFLYRNGCKAPQYSPTDKDLEGKLVVMFANSEDITTLNEIADILIRFGSPSGRDLLNVLRERNQRIEEADLAPRQIAIRRRLKGLVYGDSQNVHNETINKHQIKAAKYLINNYSSYNFWKKEPKKIYSQEFVEWRKTVGTEYDKINFKAVRIYLEEIFSDSTHTVSSVMNRIDRDNASFGIGYNLKVLFKSLWNWIHLQKDPKELEKRLIEEFKEMDGYCASGHLSRIINVMQGFTEDEKLMVRITSQQQIDSVISNYLTTEIQKDENEAASDALLMQTDLGIFYNFVIEKINGKLEELLKEYGNVKDEILSSVTKYSQAKFEWKGDKLELTAK